ncbi:MAG: lytic murein transglycosylase, partial [Devosia sp.]|nr:lytic murein transglycosylase [Devosia sp.]
MFHSTGKSVFPLRGLSALAIAAALSLSAVAPALANSASFVRGLWPQAEARGVSRSAFEAAFAGYSFSPKLMEHTKSQP